jgi:hypothetical protein
MPDEPTVDEPTVDELVAIVVRDAPSGQTTDRKLIGHLATHPYWIGDRMFILTDPEQAEDALVKNSSIVLLRTKPLSPEKERAWFEALYAESQHFKISLSEIFMRWIKNWHDSWQPHEILAPYRAIPSDEARQFFLEMLPPHKRPKTDE